MDLKVFIVKLKRANIKPEFGVFGERPTFDELSLKIITLCQIPRDRLTITFRNAEKQFIDLTNDDALQEFYKSLDPDCKYIKFVVQDSQAPDSEFIHPHHFLCLTSCVYPCCLLSSVATISSTWSAGSNLSDLSKTGKQSHSPTAWQPLVSTHLPHHPEIHILSPHFSTDNKGKRKAEAEPEEQGQRNSSVPENHLPLKRVKLGDGVHHILCLVDLHLLEFCLFFLTGVLDSRLPLEGWWP